MKLFSRVLGEGQPLLIIHGLFGMSDNWQSLANLYSDYFEVHLIDQRNHGRSPHADEFSYLHLSNDLHQYITDDAVLSEYIEEGDVRQFLLKSIYWKENGQLDFRFNLKSISQNIANVGEALDNEANCSIATLFIKGGDSNYINDDDEDLIFKHFTDAEIQTLDEVGHWLHAEKPQEFFEMTVRFCL